MLLMEKAQRSAELVLARSKCLPICLAPDPRLTPTGVGVEKLGTKDAILMKSEWQCELFSSLV
jgi:hypothetical protein